MKRKVSFLWISVLLIVFGQQALIGEAYGMSFSKPVQFYAGISGGINWSKGRRTDSVFDPLAVPPETLYFSNKNFHETNGQYSAFGGVSFSFPETRVIFGPEFYIGRSHGEQTIRETILEPLTGTSRTLVSSLSPTTYLGAVLKVGYEFLSSYTGYIVLGGEANRHINKITYVPRSNAGLGIGPDFPAGFFGKTSWLTGFIWGFGLERKFNCIQVGTDIRFADYGSFKVQQPYGPSDETVFNTFKFKNIRLSLRLSYLF
jgi:hypothetical protein